MTNEQFKGLKKFFEIRRDKVVAKIADFKKINSPSFVEKLQNRRDICECAYYNGILAAIKNSPNWDKPEWETYIKELIDRFNLRPYPRGNNDR